MRLYFFKTEDLFKEEEIKCPGCNWHTTTVCAVGESREDARKIAQEFPLCPRCIAEVIAEEFDLKKRY